MTLKQCWPILLVAAPLWAHHSWSGDYFLDKTITVKAKVTEFEYQNPHSILRLEVTNEQGAPETWIGEWAAAGKLANEGVTKGKLHPGDQVTVFGNPGRSPEEHRLHVLGVLRSDGFKWGRQN